MVGLTPVSGAVKRMTYFSDFRPRPAAIEGERILAAIDLGTNSIHMVVVKIQPDLPAFSIIDREKETVRLGNFNEHTRELTEAAMERAIAPSSAAVPSPPASRRRQCWRWPPVRCGRPATGPPF